MHRKRSSRQLIAADLEVLPLMNLFIVLIPMLLLSAVFVQISVIDMSSAASHEAREQAQAKPLELAVHIGAQAYVIKGNGIETLVIERDGAAAREAAAWTQLSEALARIGAAHPDNHEVRIVAEDTTRYEEIIAVMDVSRAAGLSHTALLGAGQARS